jgi:hypothetical protein
MVIPERRREKERRKERIKTPTAQEQKGNYL